MYRALVETVGLRTYVPYLAVVALLNVVVAILVRLQVARRAGQWPGLAAGMLVLFLGAGFENLYWGFQIGFVGATALGLAAFELLDGPPARGRAACLVIVLVAGLMTAGVALFFLGAVAVELAIRPERRRWLGLLVIPAGVYALWFALIGYVGLGAHRNPFRLESLGHVPEFLATGFGEAAGAITGLGPTLGVPVAAVVAAVAAWQFARNRSLPYRFVAGATALTLEYGLIAVTRAGVTTDQVNYTRYTYIGAILALVALGALIGPWLGTITAAPGRRRLYAFAGSVILLELAFSWNLRLLVGGRQLFLDRAEMTRALVTVSIAPDRPPSANLSRSLILVPAPERLDVLVAAFGSPLADSLEPWAVAPIRPAILAEAERRLIYGPPIPVDENVTN